MLPSDGILADGSNLTVIIALAWNAVYASTPSAAAAKIAIIIDLIKAEYPLVDVIVTGLNRPPSRNFKNFETTRIVSEEEVFEQAIKAVGTAYRAICTTRTRVEFLQISHVWDAESAYPKQDRRTGARSLDTLPVNTDYVHPLEAGAAQYADGHFYKLIHKYCQ